MTPFDRVQSLFHEALSLPVSADRAAWLRAESHGDAELCREVLDLLAAHQEMKTAGESGPSADVSVPTAAFGPYRAVRLLGRGGMSSVYLARRADGQFHQTAALKIMAGYLTGPEFLRRFETERQLLASLSHHNITRLLDGGVSSAGDPFLITEYIDGQPVDRYCDERKLDIKGRLLIFLQVCDAVDYAHRNLIVHRDLKPANILVNTEGTVKLLDFGTASLVGGQEAMTLTGARVMTPRYASPEQLRGERLSTATDVFSLGVVLYELLCGAWPFGIPGSMLSELNRASGTVCAQHPSAVITEESADRRSAPREQLRRMLRGDLSAIVLKALENDAARRYGSVSEFAADIENHLGGRPVFARPQTAVYRTRKFLRRRWLPLSAAAVFVLGISAAAVVAWEQARAARAEARKSDRVSQFLKDMLAAGTRSGPGFTVAQMLDLTEPELAKAWKDDPLTEAALRLNLGASYTTLGVPERAKMEEEKALAICEAHGDYRGAAVALWVLGQNTNVSGHMVDGEALYQRSFDMLRRLGGNAPALWDVRIRRDLGSTIAALHRRRVTEARQLVETAVAEAEKDASIPPIDLSFTQAALAEVLADQGRNQESEALLQRAWATAQRVPPAEAPMEQVAVLRVRGEMRSRRQDFAGARDLAKQVFDLLWSVDRIATTRTAAAELTWARFRAETGEVAPALAEVREAMQVVRSRWSHGNDLLAEPFTASAWVLARAGQFAESERCAREAMQVVEEARREEVDPIRAESWELMGVALAGEGKRAEAISALKRAEGLYRELGPGWVETAGRVSAALGKITAGR